jgi:hypothetical protein
MPGLLLALPATVVLQANSAVVQAAEECKAKPGPAAPAGHRWHYRVDRADHRRCWFLASRDVGERSRLRRTRLAARGEFGTDNPEEVQRPQKDLTEPEAASPPAEPAPAALTAARLADQQVVTPSLDPALQHLVPRTVSTISYTRPSTVVQTPPGLVADTQRTNELSAAAASDTKLLFFAGAAATGFLFAGGIAHFAGRRVRHRPRKQPDVQRMIAHPGMPIVRSPSLAAKLPTAPIDSVPRPKKRPRANLAILKGLKGARVE